MVFGFKLIKQILKKLPLWWSCGFDMGGYFGDEVVGVVPPFEFWLGCGTATSVSVSFWKG